MIIDRLTADAEARGLHIYDMAEQTDSGIICRTLSPAGRYHNSYSIAKLFIVTAIGMLYDRGLMTPDDPIFPLLAEAFPASFDSRFRQVTFDHLLTHRVGFGRELLDIDTENPDDWQEDDYLRLVLSEPLPHEPGTVYLYTDAAFYLLSRLLTRLSGQSPEDFFATELLAPLGFHGAAWSRCPHGYAMGATGLFLRTQDMVKLGYLYACGGVYNGRRLLSEEWVSLTLERGYELHPVDCFGTYAKAGMYGQMLAISLPRRAAYAWHALEPERDTGVLLQAVQEIKTERLLLRRWREDDAESLFRYARDPAVGPIAGWPPHTDVENSRQIIREVLSAEETYAVVLQETGEPVGSIGLMIGGQSNLPLPEDEGEIGYWIGVPYWGQGLIPEAMRALMRHAFLNCGLRTLWCGYFDGNDRSKRAQEKCGFVYQRTERDCPWPLMGDVRTEHITRLTRAEWDAAYSQGK